MNVITMKFKYVVMLLASLTIAFSSCSNDNDGIEIDKPVAEGLSTKMSLVLVQPKTYAPVDANATEEELALKTVDVYIHDANGVFVKRENFNVTGGDFVQDATDKEVWRLAPGKSISTTTGVKQIYVGVNLSSDIANAIEGTNPASFAQTIAVATELGNTAAGYAMFSTEVQSADLIELDETGDMTANTVSVGVARLLAKVVVEQAAGLSLDIRGGKIQDLKFNVSNVNTKFFALPDRVTFKDPNHESPAVFAEFIKGLEANYTGINATGTSVTDAGAVYTTENTSEGNLQGEHTYASVRGTFVPAETYSWNGTVLEKEAGEVVAGTTFYKVIADGQIYYFTEKGGGIYGAEGFAAEKSSESVEYKDGLCYYNVFLNPKPVGGETKYDILRNTIYTVRVTKINGLGDSSDSVVPTDPIADLTALSVEIEIEDWAQVSQDSELTGK